jgi:hypothetical protein
MKNGGHVTRLLGEIRAGKTLSDFHLPFLGGLASVLAGKTRVFNPPPPCLAGFARGTAGSQKAFHRVDLRLSQGRRAPRGGQMASMP